jgi:hypothetical protein
MFQPISDQELQILLSKLTLKVKSSMTPDDMSKACQHCDGAPIKPLECQNCNKAYCC